MVFSCLPFLGRPTNAALDAADVPEKSSRMGARPSAPSYRAALRASGAGSAAALAELRALMTENKLDAYVIPNEDEHGSEIPASSELRRGFMTGFHGTAGLAVVTQDEALLFTDSRYWIAAEKAMDPALWTLRAGSARALVPGGFQDFLVTLPAGSRIGVDARLIPPSLKSTLDAALPAGSRLVCQRTNLVDAVWTDKPVRSTDAVVVHPLKFTGRGIESKLAELRAAIAEAGAGAYLVTPLDDLAWLVNLRGNDTFNQPFFYAYMFVSAADAVLFIDRAEVSPEVDAYLTAAGVRTVPYGDVWDFLKAEKAENPKSAVLVDPKASYAVIEVLGVRQGQDHPVSDQHLESSQNDVEIQGFYNANLRDGVAMVRWYGWLEEQVVKKNKVVTEYEAERKLNEYR
ncbi:unnamed protein product, partial [Mycena citricolor]